MTNAYGSALFFTAIRPLHNAIYHHCYQRDRNSGKHPASDLTLAKRVHYNEAKPAGSNNGCDNSH